MNVRNTDKDIIVYQDERYTLGQKDTSPYFTADGKTYLLSCHPYEPCMYIRDRERLVAVIHNAFNPLDLMEAFAKGKTVTSISGKVYDVKAFCVTIEYAASYLYDTDISYVEGALAVKKLKESGATSPETAIDVTSLGVRSISDRFSHSKKRKERVMYTEEGKVYVRIIK